MIRLGSAMIAMMWSSSEREEADRTVYWTALSRRNTERVKPTCLSGGIGDDDGVAIQTPPSPFHLVEPAPWRARTHPRSAPLILIEHPWHLPQVSRDILHREQYQT